MPALRFSSPLTIATAVLLFACAVPPVPAQIGKVDGRYVEPRCTAWSVFSHIDFSSLCYNGLCPSCKRRYCPLDSLPNFGYSPPRWMAFPGTNPNYSPKKKDVGISTPGLPPAPREPEGTNGAMRNPRPRPTIGEPPLAPVSVESAARIEPPPVPEPAPVKPILVPEIQPDDGDK